MALGSGEKLHETRFKCGRSGGTIHNGGVFMRNMMLAIAAVGLTVPALPSDALARDSYYHGKVWRDSNGHLRCKRPNGTTGLIVGAAGGALIGHAIDTHGERATGTIIGAAAGALVGRSIDRNRYHCH
jgi:hypothetical protein